MSGPRLWVSGHNKAGFLPDSADPATPVAWADAWNSLLDEIRDNRVPVDHDIRPVTPEWDAAYSAVLSAPVNQPLAVTVRIPGELPEEWWIQQHDAPAPDLCGPNQGQSAQIGIVATPGGFEPVHAPGPQSPPA